VGSGNPVLAAGAPRGALGLSTAGWWPNTVAIGAGDYIGLGGRLYIATEAVTASGTGTATIPVAPPLRAAVVVGEPLVLSKPTVPTRLISDDEAANPTRPGRFAAITLRLSRQRIDPLLEETPALRERVAPARARDSGNTMLSKEFPGGILVLTGANSAVGLRSMTARFLFLDEVGRALAVLRGAEMTAARRPSVTLASLSRGGIT
jgi:hypothetical protein